MPRLLIENVFLKSRMNREVHVRFREELGVKIPLLTRLVAAVVGRLLMDSSFILINFCQIRKALMLIEIVLQLLDY